MLFKAGTKICPACGSDKITSFPALEIKCCHKCGYWFSWNYKPPEFSAVWAYTPYMMKSIREK